MGVVYLAEHTLMRRLVAVKVFLPERARDERALGRFYREARAAAALDHPNIVRLYDVRQAEGVHFLVLEYISGASLGQLVDSTGPLHHAQAVRHIIGAATGLAHAHEKGFVHRDVKPANLMVDRDGMVKVLDMGLARSFIDPNDRLTLAGEEGSVLGTADYLCPEQGLSEPTDARSDIYSLGITLFTLIAGHPPFPGNTTQKLVHHQMTPTPDLTEVNPAVPDGLNEVVQMMTAKRPEDRYQSAEEVIDALRPFAQHSAGEGGSRTCPRPTPRAAAVAASRPPAGGGKSTRVMVPETTRVMAAPPVQPAPRRRGTKRLILAAAVLALGTTAIAVALSGGRERTTPAGVGTATGLEPLPQPVQPPAPVKSPPVEPPPVEPPPVEPPADPPGRGEFLLLPFGRVATACSLEPLFGDDGLDRFEMADWGTVTANGIPFALVDPRGGDRMVPNIILLHTPQVWTRPSADAVVTSMPRGVTLPVGTRAAGIHLLGCVSGWGWPWTNRTNRDLFQKGNIAVIVRLRYADGETEDHPLRNGEHLADYVRRIDVPGSTFAFLTGNGRQVRQTTVIPRRAAVVQEVELSKGESDGTAPLFFAVTVEKPTRSP
jgi:hypothetical protein